jgi:hypothetical protein
MSQKNHHMQNSADARLVSVLFFKIEAYTRMWLANID